jgi:hypothetical protein
MTESVKESVPVQETTKGENPRVFFDVEIGGEPGNIQISVRVGHCRSVGSSTKPQIIRHNSL